MRSLINPEKVIGNGAAKIESFSNFMGGSTLEETSSGISAAANKISNFSRPTIKPLPGQTNSIIQNISSNVTNNIDNSVNKTIVSFKSEFQNTVSGVQKQVKSTLGDLIKNFTKDYQKRIQDNEANKPTNILKNFLDLYRNAVSFINFFGDGKNLKKIETTLKSLRKMFNDSFEVAKLVRQTIIKIVKQLSNLPTASGKAGDLDLNVSVPGGPLKNSGRGSIGSFARSPRGKAFGFAAAGLGAGAALGAGTMAMSSSDAQEAQRFQEEKLSSTVKGQDTSQSVPEGFLDSLGRIIERFSSAIENLVEGGRKSSGSSGGSSSQSSDQEQKSSDSPSSPSNPTDSSSDSQANMPGTDKDLYTLATIAGLESGSAQGRADVAQSVYNRLRDKKYGGNSVYEILTQDGQYQPAYIDPTAKGGSGARTAPEFKNIKDEASAIIAIKSYYRKRGQNISDDGAKKIIRDAIAAIQNKEYQKKAASFVGGRTDFLGYDAKLRAQIHRQVSTDNYFGAEYGNYTQNLKLGAAPIPSFVSGTGKPGAASQTSSVKPNEATSQQMQSSQIQPQEQKKAPPAVTTPPGRTPPSNNIVSTSLPPEVTVIPGGGGNQQNVMSPPVTGSEGNAPDVSMFGDTTNPNNPYWSLPFALGIINA